MSDPNVTLIGEIEDEDGMVLAVYADYDAVKLTIAGLSAFLSQHQAEEFAQLFTAACWQAAQQQREMRDEGDPMTTEALDALRAKLAAT